MPSHVRLLIRRRPVVTFFALAYALSWAWYLPLAARGAVVRAGEGWPTHLPGLLGPALAAVIVTGIVDGRGGLRDLVRRVVRWRIGRRWWAIVAGTLSLALLGYVVPLLTGADPPQVSDFTRYTGIGAITPLGVVAVALVVNGLGEETGWRGFAVERLLQEHSLTWTAVVVAIGWAGWHLPFFWFVESFRGMGPLVVGWAVSMLAGSLVLTWLYREGDHSVLLVATWHTAFNLTSATEATGPVVGTATSVVVICWALWILRRDQDAIRRPMPVQGPDGDLSDRVSHEGPAA